MKPMEVVLKRLQTLEYNTKKLEREVEHLKKENTSLQDKIEGFEKVEKPEKKTDEISAGWFWQ